MRPIIESCREDKYGDCHWPTKTDKWVLTNECPEGRHDTGEHACNREDKPLAESLQCHTGTKSKHQDTEQVKILVVIFIILNHHYSPAFTYSSSWWDDGHWPKSPITRGYRRSDIRKILASKYQTYHYQKLNFVLDCECCCCEHPVKLQYKKISACWLVVHNNNIRNIRELGFGIMDSYRGIHVHVVSFLQSYIGPILSGVLVKSPHNGGNFYVFSKSDSRRKLARTFWREIQILST